MFDHHSSPLLCCYGSPITLNFYRSNLCKKKKKTLCHIVWPWLIIERLPCCDHAKAMILKNLSAAFYMTMTSLEGNKPTCIHNARVEHIHRAHVRKETKPEVVQGAGAQWKQSVSLSQFEQPPLKQSPGVWFNNPSRKCGYFAFL